MILLTTDYRLGADGLLDSHSGDGKMPIESRIFKLEKCGTGFAKYDQTYNEAPTSLFPFLSKNAGPQLKNAAAHVLVTDDAKSLCRVLCVVARVAKKLEAVQGRANIAA